jgi:hypothetical protein
MGRVKIQIEALAASRTQNFDGVTKFTLECDQTSANKILFGPTGSASMPVYQSSSREFDAGEGNVFNEEQFDINFDTANAGQNIGWLISFIVSADKPRPGEVVKKVERKLAEIHQYLEQLVGKDV